MGTDDFWLTLLIGVALGMLFIIALRWIGGKLLGRNQQQGGGDAYKKTAAK